MEGFLQKQIFKIFFQKLAEVKHSKGSVQVLKHSYMQWFPNWFATRFLSYECCYLDCGPYLGLSFG